MQGRAIPIFLLLLTALTLAVLTGDPEAGATPDLPPPHFVPELGLPATGVVGFGPTPAEGPQ
jgi:hypothetical protein